MGLTDIDYRCNNSFFID